MPIPFTCPHCGSFTNVDDQYAGQSGACVNCGKPITTPAAGTPRPGSQTPSQNASGCNGCFVAALVVFAICSVIALLLPAFGGASIHAKRSQCSNYLKQIALAIHNYHDTFKCLPSAVLTDEDGRPMRSWRVAIVPFVEEGPLYERYNCDEPWDSPSNRTLLSERPYYFACPGDSILQPQETSYVMIVGEGTAGGEPNEVVTFEDITDGPENTILAIEVVGAGIDWTEPRDLTVDEAITYITNPDARGVEHAHRGGVNVVFIDGSVHQIPSTIDPQTLRNLLTRDDGLPVDF